MKAIIVESLNGYMALGPDDDMSWTPGIDKKLFKFLTYAIGTPCIVSKHTWELLPDIMKKDPNREFIVAEKTGMHSLDFLKVVMPNAILIGGPRFLKLAHEAGMIDKLIVTTTNDIIRSAGPEYLNPFIQLCQSRKPLCSMSVEDVRVRIYSCQ